ncbi:MAG: hypothetical protein P4L69_17380 [Desulfosporosinus sp.]|nr:hypothetical protein [Desulfosporosinus sp.]
MLNDKKIESLLNLVKNRQKRIDDKKKRAEEEAKRQREKTNEFIKKYWMFFLGAFIALILIVSFGIWNERNDQNDATKIAINSSSSEFKGKNYESVVTQLQKISFTNIKTEALDDLVTGLLKKDGEVEHVSINGNTNFSSNSYFSKDAQIIITYHTFPKKEESRKETAQEPKLAEDGSQAIYKDAIGKPAIDIYNKLEGLGYKVSFKNAVTKLDFTSAVQYESDPADAKSYIPWLITDVDSYSATSKTASFFINTQKMIDKAQNRRTAEDALQAKLDVSSAWGAVDLYGNREYPYGFKLEIATGRLAETAVDENTWFLKAKCEVKNEYGTWMKNLVCEARVSGTTASPQIVDFRVYNP